MKIVCMDCGQFFKPKKTGIYIEECCEDGRPYKLWASDLFACQGCRKEIAADFGQSPIAEHYERNYMVRRARYSIAGTAR